MVCSLSKSGDSVKSEFKDLREGMPDNSMIDVSLQTFEDEVNLEK